MFGLSRAMASASSVSESSLVDDQHRQLLVERHDAQRVQIEPRVGNFLGVALDRLRTALPSMRASRLMRSCLLAEESQSQAASC